MFETSLESLTDGLSGEITNGVIGGMIGGIIAAVLIIGLIFYIITVIASWKIFEKAGEKGWKALIPIYNTYIMFKIVDMQPWFWALIGASVASSIVMLLNNYPMFAVSVEEMELRLNATTNPVVLITSLAISVISLAISIVYAIRTAKVFGKGNWFAAGLFFLTPIFWLILAFGKAKYNKKKLNK